MDWLLSALGIRFKWAWTRLPSAGDMRPRFVGQPVSFELFLNSDPNSYESKQVMGTLDAMVGNEILVSGDFYDLDNVSNIRVWRKEIDR